MARQGEKGDTGPQGEKGEQGDTGPQGEKGEQGDIGPQGEKGEQGDIGPQGEKGEQGNTGPQGERGEQGAAGSRGEKGDGFQVFSAANAANYQMGECIVYNGLAYIVVEKPSDTTPPDASGQYLSFSVFYQRLKTAEDKAKWAADDASRANQRLDNLSI